MSTANNCAILTILPLGVSCSVTGTTSPLTTDGAVEITITGGSEPYFIQWLDSNNQPLGISSTFRNNLDVGNYKSIVTDVYGDFSATTICEVTPDSIFVEQFTNCYDSTLLYVSGNTPTTLFTQNKVYTLLGYTGCWEKTNRFLNTSALPYVSTTRLSGPYNFCSDCLPAGVIPISPSMTATNTPTPTLTPTITPTKTLTPTPTPTNTITPTKTPTQTPTPTPSETQQSYVLTLNTITSVTQCARGTIQIKKNGITVATYTKLVGSGSIVPSVASVNYLASDTITVVTNAQFIAGAPPCDSIVDTTTTCIFTILGTVSTTTADISTTPSSNTYTLLVNGNYTVSGSFISS